MSVLERFVGPMYFHTCEGNQQCFHETEMQCTSLVSAITHCFHLLGVGGEVEAIEHRPINEYFTIGCVVSLDGVLD